MSDDTLWDQAAGWHAKQGADDMDWQAFEVWLGANPRHRDAFDDIALLDGDVDRHRDTLRRSLPATESGSVSIDRRVHRRGWIGGGAAAVMATAAVVLVLATRETPPAPSATASATYRAAAVPRDVRIAGARITLAPRSNLVSESGEPTQLALSGRAVFAVRHDPGRTLVVRGAGYDIRDIGTRFEVVAGAGMVRVSVAEGEVAIRRAGGGGEMARVGAGRVATGFADGTIVTGAAGRAPLKGQSGPLLYDAMPLGLVAADLARATGRPVVAEPDVAARSFTGVLAKGDAEAMTRTLATLAGLEVRRQGDTIHLGTRVRP